MAGQAAQALAVRRVIGVGVVFERVTQHQLLREQQQQAQCEVQQAVAQSLRQQAFATALKQACAVLAAHHEVEGADLDAAASPLLQ